MRISVVIPTLGRPGPLSRCLDALDSQERPPDQILVVYRPDDEETAAALSGRRVQGVAVHAPGAVAALNAGLERADGEIVAMTDDDTVPHPDWLARIEGHLAAGDGAGGVGGRDVLEGVAPDAGARVGRLRLIRGFDGNHHVGAGPPRDVDVLKGANMAFRADAIRGLRFDPRLHGTGAQVHLELDFGLAVKRRGWRLVYDPLVLVDHYPARRFDEDARRRRSSLAVRNEAHNETYVLLRWLPWPRKVGYLAYALAVGTRRLPGLSLALERALRGREPVEALRAMRAATCGRLLAIRTYVHSHRRGA